MMIIWLHALGQTEVVPICDPCQIVGRNILIWSVTKFTELSFVIHESGCLYVCKSIFFALAVFGNWLLSLSDLLSNWLFMLINWAPNNVFIFICSGYNMMLRRKWELPWKGAMPLAVYQKPQLIIVSASLTKAWTGVSGRRIEAHITDGRNLHNQSGNLMEDLGCMRKFYSIN